MEKYIQGKHIENKDETENLKNEILHELEELKENIPTSIGEIIKDILNEEDTITGDSLDASMKEYIENKQYIKAISHAFIFFWKAILSKNKSTGLENFQDIENKISGFDIKNVDENLLINTIDIISKKIDEVYDINKKLRLTYILSLVKNLLLQTKMENNTIQKKDLFIKTLLENHIAGNNQIGNVILINKVSKRKIGNTGDKLLSAYNKNKNLPVGFLHSVIITKIVDQDIYITHSTINRLSSNKSGVEEIKLTNLLENYNAADVLILETEEALKENTLIHINQIKQIQENTKKSLYDKKAAISKAFPIINENPNKVNCVELIAEGLDEEKIKNIKHPNDFLQSDFMKPIYLTTF